MEKKFCLHEMPWETVLEKRYQKQVDGKNISVINMQYEKGCHVEHHKHPNEQISMIQRGHLKIKIEDREYDLKEGDSIVIPPNMVHSWDAIEDSETLEILSPPRN